MVQKGKEKFSEEETEAMLKELDPENFGEIKITDFIRIVSSNMISG
jgi:Ca2+-binding EF-hand superfamily protein